jgi:hypothetical protein
MRTKVMGVFGEARNKAVVDEEFVQEDGRRVPKALLSVDLEVQGKGFQ